MYICIYVYVYVYVCIYIYIYMYMYTSLSLSIYIYETLSYEVALEIEAFAPWPVNDFEPLLERRIRVVLRRVAMCKGCILLRSRCVSSLCWINAYVHVSYV